MPAIAIHHTGTSDASWDGPAAKANLKLNQDRVYYSQAFAWYDPKADEANKSAYKFIHHQVTGSGEVGAANVTACSAGIAVLNGARGGANIPDADRKAVWAHLAAHLKDAGQDVPELKDFAHDCTSVTVPFELKEVAEDGQFIGYAAIYGNVDLGGDLIERGAFTKTLQENAGKLPLFSEHRVAIGISSLEDSDLGLKSVGYLNLDKQVARDVHSDLKFYHKHGRPLGMSIGYKSIPDKTEFKNGVRHLKEVKLFENTVTIIPMNPAARVIAVKSLRGEELKSNFSDEYASAQAMSQPGMMLNALCCALSDLLYDGDMTDDEKVSAASDSIADFGKQYTGMLPAYLSAMADMMGAMKAAEIEQKAGRAISKDTARRIQAAMDRHRSAAKMHKQAIDEMQALLDEAAAGSGTSGKSGAAEEVPVSEPVQNHSGLLEQLDQLKGALQWSL